MKRGSADWHEARRNAISAGDAAAILGLDDGKTREDVMREMVRRFHGAPSEFQSNIVSQWQVMNTPTAIGEFELETGRDVQPAVFMTYKNILGCMVDGFVGNDGIFMAYCPFHLRHSDTPVPFKAIREMPKRLLKAQVQMFITNTVTCYFWQWTPKETRLEIVEYDHAIVRDTIGALTAFYDEFLDECGQPEGYLEAKRVVIDTPKAAAMVREYAELGDAISNAKERQQELLEEMVAMAKGRDAMFAGAKLTKAERAGSISYAKAIKELVPGANLEPWRGKPSSYWTLSGSAKEASGE